VSRLTVYEFLKFLSASDKEALEAYRPLAHQRVVLTGKLAEGVTRETLTAALYKWGAVIEDRVSPSTDVLLAVDPDRMTVKRKDAAKYGITVLDEYGFTTWLTKARERALEDATRLGSFTAPPPPAAWFVDPEADEEDPDFEDTIAPLSDFGA
jgi:hypothetical protein